MYFALCRRAPACDRSNGEVIDQTKISYTTTCLTKHINSYGIVCVLCFTNAIRTAVRHLNFIGARRTLSAGTDLRPIKRNYSAASQTKNHMHTKQKSNSHAIALVPCSTNAIRAAVRRLNLVSALRTLSAGICDRSNGSARSILTRLSKQNSYTKNTREVTHKNSFACKTKK